MADDDKLIMILLTFFLGYLGIHRMYKKHWLSGIVYLCTGGLLTIGVWVDLIWLILDKPLMWQK